MYDALNKYLAEKGLVVDQTAVTNRATLLEQAKAAITVNKTYLALSSPTAAQTTAEVKSLARQMNAIIKIIENDLATTE